MLIQLAGRFVIDPVQYPRRLVVELDCGDSFTGEGHPECGVFSGRFDGFRDLEEMNQRMPELPIEEECGTHRFEIRAPNRSCEHQCLRYHYVAIGWGGRVYVAYPRATEITLGDVEGAWSVSIECGAHGVTVLMSDYAPWDEEGSHA